LITSLFNAKTVPKISYPVVANLSIILKRFPGSFSDQENGRVDLSIKVVFWNYSY